MIWFTHLNTRFSVVDDHAIRQVSGHNEVMLHNEGGLLGVQDETLDQLGARNTLLARKQSTTMDHDKKNIRGKEKGKLILGVHRGDTNNTIYCEIHSSDALK